MGGWARPKGVHRENCAFQLKLIHAGSCIDLLEEFIHDEAIINQKSIFTPNQGIVVKGSKAFLSESEGFPKK